MTRLHVVVPAYDCFEWLPACLDSVLAQTHPDVVVTVVDDASTDERMRRYVGEIVPLLDQAWTGIVNTQRVGATANIYNAVHGRPNEGEVVVLLDGDDALHGDDALARIAAVYDNPDVWLAYGSYRSEPHNPECHPAEPYPPEVIDAGTYRQWSTLFNHPLTFRRDLFDVLDRDDLRLDSGEWVPGIYDEAIMYPMLELSGWHTKCMTDVTYVYNTANPLSVVRAQADAISAAGEELRSRQRKAPLSHLPKGDER